MKISSKKNFFQNLLILLIFIQLFSLNITADVVQEINQDVPGNTNYKKREFSSDITTLNFYFKYSFSKIPDSRITAFRFEFDQFSDLAMELNSVHCTFVSESDSDETLIEELRLLTSEKSSCIGNFTYNGYFDGIIKHDPSKTKLGIYLVSRGGVSYTARLFLRTTEKLLDVKEQTVMDEENYSLVPYTVVISNFRDVASRILFYSYTRELQMYYVEEDTNYPSLLFCGNIMSVYTNPNMVRQKYHNANTMILLTRDFSKPEVIGEQFKYQVKLFPSNFQLEYYVSSNPEGRSKNSPLVVNMTVCTEPYYVILNYNKPEKQMNLYIDQMYGRIKEMYVAPNLKSSTWEKMLEKDMQYIRASDRKFTLPKEAKAHTDVYKVECEIPSLLNLYYIDETADIPELDYGQVVVTTLKPYKSISLPFKAGISLPELTVEVFNPIKLPFVMVNDGQNENMVDKNQIIRSMPFTTMNPLIVKERGGDSNTRLIIKVGYSSRNFEQIEPNILYSSKLNMFAIKFPNDETKRNFTKVNLLTKGVTSGDNVKYCYGTNIGCPIMPSAENCFRVSLENTYTLTVLNPMVMHKDYELQEDLSYYISIKPVSISDRMGVLAQFVNYDTNERNIEGISHKIQINGESVSTILTPPANRDVKVFTQVQQCDNSEIKMEVLNAYDPTQTVVAPISIPAGSKNFYHIFQNILLESELKISGNSGTNVFVKHAGVYNTYTPSINPEPSITFNPALNQLTITNPLNNYERIRYTILVSMQNQISQAGLTLCSFADGNKFDYYTKTVESYNLMVTVNINFNRIDLKSGETFEAIVLSQQLFNSKMEFLSNVITDKVGEIKDDVVTEITESFDEDYAYITQTAKAKDMSYYFSYLQKDIDFPVGALRVELDQSATGELSAVDCAFVDEDETASGMVEAVEDIIDSHNPYCIGGKSTTDGNRLNYIFKYELNSDKKPKRLVIKVSNGKFADGKYSIYIKKSNHQYIERTNFTEQKEYGRKEEFAKSITPYIVDLKTIRGDSADEYVSKMIIYSKYLELQMYYLDDSGKNHGPVFLFAGNILMLYTKLALAEQKYHAKTLILLSEKLTGQEHSSLGNNFRFHTKMFKSEAQIEYYVSNNPTGRTLNYPLGIEMNTCTEDNNKFYFILNYNREEQEKIVYLDVVFGKYSTAKVAYEITEERWDSLIPTMVPIEDFQHTLPNSQHHIDIIEIECMSPLKVDVLYNNEDEQYIALITGDVAIKNLKKQQSTIISINNAVTGSFYFSISVFSPQLNPDMTFKFGNMGTTTIKENSLQIGVLPIIPETISVTNNGNSDTRFVLKLGYGVESEWTDEGEQISGKLYSQDNKYVYKFPIGENKLNFTNVTFEVKAMKKGSTEELPNVKFCYSTSIGMPIDASHENCFRTGVNIPYSLTFLNPLSFSKNYKPIAEFYYVTFMPYYFNEFISLKITENKYNIQSRNIEGYPNVITFNAEEEKTILSAPKSTEFSKMMVQLQICNKIDAVVYSNVNPYTGDVISLGSIEPEDKFFTYSLDNNFIETELVLFGKTGEEIFVKHMGYSTNKLIVQKYFVSFDLSSNTASIVKPIKSEEFKITVFVAKKGKLENYSLCTIVKVKESEYKTIADYSKTFISSDKSDIVDHFIDFRSFGYKAGDEFDILIYAVQTGDVKAEFLYNVLTAMVGEIKGPTQIEGTIPGKPDFATQIFTQNKTNNYLFYNFPRNPIGNVASLKIKELDQGSAMRVTKIGCTFVRKDATDEDMISAINEAIVNSKSVCVGETQKDSNGFDALINAMDVANGYSKLVIEVMYGIGDDEDTKEQNIKKANEGAEMNITIRTNGYQVETQNFEYNEPEELSLVPYVLDLNKIRESGEENYVSKILIYSNTNELQMFYISNGAPVELFSGHIMLVYTNKDVIKEKYKGASTMILLTDSLSREQKPSLGVKYKFKVHFFDSAKTIQYYVSANSTGRQLYNPTSIEMLSCDQPYYYILNYNYPEGNRILHIDNIFGVVNTMRIATQLNDENWYDFVEHMTEIEGNEYLIQGQKKHHIDVIEVTCKVPLLLNVYYTDPTVEKVSNLQEGDITIINLPLGKSQTLKFKPGLPEDLVYSFNVIYEGEASNPLVLVKFEDDEIDAVKNGIYTKQADRNYDEIVLTNKMVSGSTDTKVIFKLGYSIENSFTKIKNDVYNLQTSDRKSNLFGYIFKNGEDKLNYTKINFTVRTAEENVKFCYTTNLGAYIEPSLQNCFRVGRGNSYTIPILNPYIMFKDYFFEDSFKYYVSFQTADINQNITIEPELIKYSTKTRNIEGYGQSITLGEDGKGSSILSTSEKNTELLLVQMKICTRDVGASFEFRNAFYNKSLEQSGDIPPNYPTFFRNIKNTNLDTELIFTGVNSSNIFIKHVGISSEYSPSINEFKPSYDPTTHVLTFNQPIDGELFNYIILLDKKGNLERQQITLCSFVTGNKLAHYSAQFSSSEKILNYTFDFGSEKLIGYEDNLDIYVMAEQFNKGQLSFLSDIIQYEKKEKGKSDGEGDTEPEDSNIALIIIICVLSVLLIGGGIFIFLCLRRTKQKTKGNNPMYAQTTNLDDLQGQKQEKLTNSMSESQASENQKIQ